MSVKVMGAVWDSFLPQREKLVLLAYADHSHDDGSKVFPSVGLIARKTGYSTRSVQRITKTLVEKEYMTQEGTTKYGTKLYKIMMDNLPMLPPYLGDDKLTGAKYGGDSLSEVGVTKRQGGDNLNHLGVTNTTPGGDIAMSPDPLLTIKEPSLRANDLIFTIYEQEIGPLTPMIAEQIKDWIENYPQDWIEEAITIAVENNARKVAYINAILKNRRVDGKYSGEKPSIDKELERKGYVQR